MRTATVVAQGLVRIIGIILIILGIFFQTGHALPLIPVHMLLGLIFVLALWTLAFVAGRAGGNAGFVTLVAVWGVIVLVFGMMQTSLMVGNAHWVIQVLHLVIGLVAMGLGDRLGRRILSRSTAPAAG